MKKSCKQQYPAELMDEEAMVVLMKTGDWIDCEVLIGKIEHLIRRFGNRPRANRRSSTAYRMQNFLPIALGIYEARFGERWPF